MYDYNTDLYKGEPGDDSKAGAPVWRHHSVTAAVGEVAVCRRSQYSVVQYNTVPVGGHVEAWAQRGMDSLPVRPHPQLLIRCCVDIV